MALCKRLAIGQPVKQCSMSEYLAQLDISKHCFAICLLFITGKINMHYPELEYIQENHCSNYATSQTELAPQDCRRLHLTEQSSPDILPKDFGSYIQRYAMPNNFMLVISTDDIRHSIGFTKMKNSNSFYLLNTSICAKNKTMSCSICTDVTAYFENMCELQTNIQKPVRSVKILSYLNITFS